MNTSKNSKKKLINDSVPMRKMPNIVVFIFDTIKTTHCNGGSYPKWNFHMRLGLNPCLTSFPGSACLKKLTQPATAMQPIRSWDFTYTFSDWLDLHRPSHDALLEFKSSGPISERLNDRGSILNFCQSLLSKGWRRQRRKHQVKSLWNFFMFTLGFCCFNFEICIPF